MDVLTGGGKGFMFALTRVKKWLLVCADDGSLARILNPSFSPQAFGFAQGRLVWIQQTPGVPEVKLFVEFVRATR